MHLPYWLFSFSFTSSYVEAQESSKPKKQIKYKKARALQPQLQKKWQKFMKL